MAQHQVVVVGGGLAGLSACHTALDAGHRVLLLEKNAFAGGNSTKATSGINGGGTRTQKKLGINDSNEQFYEDTVRSATGIKKGPLPEDAWYPLGKVLSFGGSEAVHWCQDKFGLALDAVSRLGGHTNERTHRSQSGGKFPGMEITYTLITAFEKICEAQPDRARMISRARVNRILCDASGNVTGVQYEKGGETFAEAAAAVIIATGGYGAGGLSADSLLKEVRPDLIHLPTTNGAHCTGDGVRFARDVGADTVDIDYVQVHPTGLVPKSDPNARTLFLAAEALRGEGGILIDRNGKRFCNDLGTRDYVTGRMWEHNQGPYRLLLNSKASSAISWHCEHYVGRGVMEIYNSGADLCREMNIPVANLQSTLRDYNSFRKNDSDPWGKPARFMKGGDWDAHDTFHVAIVTPVVHYCMGGLKINERAEVIHTNGHVIKGLYCAGEAAGGVHGKNRLGGSALLECVVFGRVAGSSASHYLASLPAGGAAGAGGSGGSVVTITIPQPNGTDITVTVSGAGASGATAAASPSPAPPLKTSGAAAKAAAVPGTGSSAASSKPEKKQYTMAEVAKHKTAEDCWVVVNGEVLDVTGFLDDHPGGKMAIMTFAGRDATTEFNMLHDKDVVAKYAPACVIGTVAPASKL